MYNFYNFLFTVSTCETVIEKFICEYRNAIDFLSHENNSKEPKITEWLKYLSFQYKVKKALK